MLRQCLLHSGLEPPLRQDQVLRTTLWAVPATLLPRGHGLIAVIWTSRSSGPALGVLYEENVEVPVSSNTRYRATRIPDPDGHAGVGLEEIRIRERRCGYLYRYFM